MTAKTIVPFMRRMVLVALAIPALAMVPAAVFLYYYYADHCPRSPDPVTGHVIRFKSRGGPVIYLTSTEQFELFGLSIGWAPFLFATYRLRRRWNNLGPSQIIPDYDKVRATYKDQ